MNDQDTQDETPAEDEQTLFDVFNRLLRASNLHGYPLVTDFDRLDASVAERSADDIEAECLELAVKTTGKMILKTTLIAEHALKAWMEKIDARGVEQPMPPAARELLDHLGRQHRHLKDLAEARAKINRTRELAERGRKTLELLPPPTTLRNDAETA